MYHRVASPLRLLTFSVFKLLGVDFEQLLQLADLVRLLVYRLAQVLVTEGRSVALVMEGSVPTMGDGETEGRSVELVMGGSVSTTGEGRDGRDECSVSDGVCRQWGRGETEGGV